MTLDKIETAYSNFLCLIFYFPLFLPHWSPKCQVHLHHHPSKFSSYNPSTPKVGNRPFASLATLTQGLMLLFVTPPAGHPGSSPPQPGDTALLPLWSLLHMVDFELDHAVSTMDVPEGGGFDVLVTLVCITDENMISMLLCGGKV